MAKEFLETIIEADGLSVENMKFHDVINATVKYFRESGSKELDLGMVTDVLKKANELYFKNNEEIKEFIESNFEEVGEIDVPQFTQLVKNAMKFIQGQNRFVPEKLSGEFKSDFVQNLANMLIELGVSNEALRNSLQSAVAPTIEAIIDVKHGALSLVADNVSVGCVTKCIGLFNRS